jgi:hypothetical protein
MDLHAQRHLVARVIPPNWLSDVAIAYDGSPFLSVRVLSGRQEETLSRLRQAGLPGPYEVVGYPDRVRRQNPEHPSEPIAPYRYPVESPISPDQLVDELGTLLHRTHLCDGNPPAEVWLWDPLDREHAKNPRRYAQVIPELRRFEFARAMLQLPRCHRLGLLAHEIGHVLDPSASEVGADRIAGQVLGVKIGYDRRWPGKGLQVARNC